MAPETAIAARDIPLLGTKLAVPAPRSSLVDRPRLRCLLDGAATERLTVVVAPAGFGKSTVVGQWAAQASAPVAWLSLDTLDNDPTRFLLYVLAALERVLPGAGAAARSLLVSPQPETLESALTVLVNDLQMRPAPAVLVLDDYHLIETRDVHDAVSFLIEHMPDSMRLLIASRVDPPLPLARWRVRGQLGELRAADLRFTVEEATAFLQDVMRLPLDAPAIARLEERTEGWIAGLQLAALSLQGRADTASFLDAFGGTHRYIVDYLVDEVLQGQPPEVQSFLLMTAILERLSGPLCDAVTGRTDGQAMLERLEAANLFLIPLDDDRRWYRYHHLFADVLRLRLRHKDPDRIALLHERAVVWLEESGRIEEAVTHALAAGAQSDAARLIERYGEEIWMGGGQRTIDRWLLELPQAIVLSRPRLAVMRAGALLLSGRSDDPAPLIAAADREGAPHEVRAQARAIAAHYARIAGENARAVALSEQALELMPETDGHWRVVILLNLGAVRWREGDMAGAEAAMRESVELSRTAGDMPLSLLSLSLLAEAHEQQGRLTTARAVYEEAERLAAERRLRQIAAICLADAGLGRVRYEEDDMAAAERWFREGIDCAHPEFSVESFAGLAQLLIARGDLAQARRVTEEMREVVQEAGTPWVREYAEAIAARVGISERQVDIDWMRQHATEDAATRGVRPAEVEEYIAVTWAQGALATGRADEARSRLRPALDRAVREGRFGSAMSLRVATAIAALQAGQSEQARDALIPALALAEREPYRRVFLDAGTTLSPALADFAARGPHASVAGRLLGAVSTASPAPSGPSRGKLSVEPLSDRELEVLRLLAAGQSNQEIADTLFISVGTVKRHVHNIYGKLDAASRLEAVARAREASLL